MCPTPELSKDCWMTLGPKGKIYKCKHCSRATGTTNWAAHCRTPAHQANLARAVDGDADSESSIGEHGNANTEQPGEQEEVDEELDTFRKDIEGFMYDNDDSSLSASRQRQSLEEELVALQAGNVRAEGILNDADVPRILETELEAIGSDGGNAPGVDPIIKRTDKRSDRVNKSPWFPFKSKLDLVASLIVGHTHSLISRLLYEKIRAALTICELRLPGWATVRASRARIRELISTKVKASVSVFETPCYALSAQTILAQDLANPVVAEHLDHYPEFCNGQNISKFSQSYKWLAGLPRDMRPPMVDVNGKHFYIYEPVTRNID
ncbi:hypothetical protein H4Q26_011650 [Puccinia striiformis f. sp. tritici PST-130]|nr:hypothetical protein H4Q26_011650 [Puccinia striiformis f. sp. tritici PST-130]